MCGIAGCYTFAEAAKPLGLADLRHRGPDSTGDWLSSDGQVWFGHTRLAILDVSPSGHQPMHDAKTGNCIIFNGEIYNHLLLRQELKAQGVAFYGESDTETLLQGFQVWGESLLPRLKGMFAFAIYDASREAVWLARDRLGIKPLYFARETGRRLLFASEVRWLARRLATPSRPTKETVAAYLQAGSCPHRNLLFPEIQEFPTASSQWIFRDGPKSPARYWKLNVRQLDKTPRSEAAKHVRSLLETAIREHMISDVPVASLLSGGIDSSIVTAIASTHSPKRINTFSVGFAEKDLDETVYAQEIADRYGTNHHHCQLSEEEVLENVQDAVRLMDLPTLDAINTFIVVRRVAAAGYKVALSGLGGDEVFGGYPQFRALPTLRFLSFAPRFLTELLIRLGKARHFLREIPARPDTAIFDLWWRRIWGSYLLRQCGFPVPQLQLDEMPPNLDQFGRLSWTEINHYMRDTLLRDSDQMSMAVSLELRVPFLDHQLVEYVLALPAATKHSDSQVKSLLVESCSDLLPPNIYQRTKMGFVLPMEKWMRGPLQTFVEDGLNAVHHHRLLSASGTETLRSQFVQKKLHWSRLWAISVLGHNLNKMDWLSGKSGIVDSSRPVQCPV